MSGSEDGTVRQVDIREPLTGGSQQDHPSSGHENINVIGKHLLCAWLSSSAMSVREKSLHLCDFAKTMSQAQRLLLISPAVVLAADQRQERTGCAKTKVGVNSIAVMPLNPHIFVTGGSDALGTHLLVPPLCHIDASQWMFQTHLRKLGNTRCHQCSA